MRKEVISIIELMETQLAFVNEWLKFAEAKNGILIALTSGAIWGSLTLIVTENVPCWLRLYLISVICFSGIALMLSLVSFLPIIVKPDFDRESAKNERDNLLFFADIAKYAPKDLVEQLALLQKIRIEELNPLVYSYAEQVVANAQITNKKLRLFHFGVVSLAFGFLMPIAAIVGFLLLHLGGCL